MCGVLSPSLYQLSGAGEASVGVAYCKMQVFFVGVWEVGVVRVLGFVCWCCEGSCGGKVWG